MGFNFLRKERKTGHRLSFPHEKNTILDFKNILSYQTHLLIYSNYITITCRLSTLKYVQSFILLCDQFLITFTKTSEDHKNEILL